MTRYAILEAPTHLGLRPTGVERLGGALLDAGLGEALHARHAGRVAPADAYDPAPRSRDAVRNARGIAAHAPRLADAVGRVLDAGEFPVVLGGDCSVLLGDLLALRRRGRYGLLFLDGHDDFYLPETSATGEAADMDLALATGRGPSSLSDLEGRGPLVRDADVAVLGPRDADEARANGADPLPASILSRPLAAIRAEGLAAAADAALARVARAELDGFWIHLDADVLDDAVMPAVDYRLPGGLTSDEVAHVLRAARATGRAVGLEVTIYNPALDPGGGTARGLADCLAAGLR